MINHMTDIVTRIAFYLYQHSRPHRTMYALCHPNILNLNISGSILQVRTYPP